MEQNNVTLTLSFETVVQLISGLEPQDKWELLEALDAQLDAELSPEEKTAFDEARSAYEKGDYQPLEELKAALAAKNLNN